MVTVASLLQLL